MKFALKLPQVNRSWLMLGGAVALGLVALWGSQKVLNDRLKILDASLRGQYKMVDVVVAKRDMGRGEPVAPDRFAVRSVPAEFVSSSAVRPERFGSFAGRKLSVTLKGGEPLLSVDVESAAVEFSSSVTNGNRGLTTEVDEVNSISGMLRPTDHIDLLVTARGTGASTTETTFPLLTNVEVLATGQSTHKAEGSEQMRTYTTITLQVSPQDAQRVIVAKSSGKLTAVLRNPEDAQAGTTTPMNINDLIPKKHPEVKYMAVQYIVGGRS
jgi:pilus assembly protein CpaB